jgi:hypothetical protein
VVAFSITNAPLIVSPKLVVVVPVLNVTFPKFGELEPFIAIVPSKIASALWLDEL